MTRRNYWQVNFSYLAQIKVKVRSKRSPNQKYSNESFDTFRGPFWTKNSIVTVNLQFNFIWTQKNAKFKSWSGKNFKKGQIFKKYIFLKTKTSLMQNLLSNLMVPIIFLYAGYNFKKRIWRYDVIIVHNKEDKNIPFGCQKLSCLVETLHTGWTQLVLQHIIRFLFFFEKFDSVVIFQKQWNFWCKKNKISTTRDCHFVDLVILCITHLSFVFPLKTIFGEFSNMYLLSVQSRVKQRHKIRPISKHFRPILIGKGTDLEISIYSEKL